MVVAVRVIKIFGTKDNHFLTLEDVTKMNAFSSHYEEVAEIFSKGISGPSNLTLLPEF